MTLMREQTTLPQRQPLTPARGFAPPVGLPNRRRRHAERWFAFAGISLISIGFIFPFIWMLSTSLKTLDKTMAYPPRLIPDQVELRQGTPIPDNYFRVLTHDKMDFPRYTRNTLVIAALSVIGTVFSCSLVAYGFAKIPFRGRGILFAILL